MKLYKYMQLKYALEYLRTKELKVATIVDVNDPNEWYPYLVNEASEENFLSDSIFREVYKAHYGNKYGFISFSECCDNTLMWAHYGNNFAGVVLEFDVDNEKEVDKLTEVTYCSERIRLDAKSILTANMETVNQLIARKGKEWEYEAEWRVIVGIDNCTFVEQIDGKTILTHPVDTLMRLSGIILGPVCTITEFQLLSALEQWQDSDIAISRLRPDGKTFSYKAAHWISTKDLLPRSRKDTP